MKSIQYTTIILLFFNVMVKNNCDAQNQLNELISNSIIPFDSFGNITNEFELKLKNSLKDVKVIALGESLHDDGLTFKHKTKMVKFLHEKLGFNVLAFEYGFYGNWNTNKKFNDRKDTKKITKYSGWSKSKYAFPVYEYISKTQESANPLIYAGFDSEKVPDGIPNIQNYLIKIINLVNYSIKEHDSKLLDSLVHAVYGKIGSPYKNALKYKSRKHSIDILNELYKEIDLNSKQLILQVGKSDFMMYKLTIKSILMDEKSTYAGAFSNIIRDKHMAERVIWLTDSLYPNEKVILWGASAHFARNMVAIKRKLQPESYGYFPYFQMGDWLFNYYENSYYSIAFTSASGKTGLIFPKKHKYKKYEKIEMIPFPNINSFEGIAYHLNKNILYCDLRNIKGNIWLNSKFISYPFGYNHDTAIWKNVIDGIYFIREMKPNEWN